LALITNPLSNIREALLEVGDNDNDLKIQSEAKSLARTEIGDFEFIVSIVIWYQILSTVNIASKKLQGENMLIDVAMKEVKTWLSSSRVIEKWVYLVQFKWRRKLHLKWMLNRYFLKGVKFVGKDNLTR
jgi:hypothetical protein